MDKLLDINEAAKLLNVNPETLRRWDDKGKIIAVRINDRGDRRYRESDILNLIKENQVIIYKGYSINWDSDGFLSMPANFGLIGRIVAYSNERFIGFAFAISGLSSFERVGLKDTSKEKAIEKIKEYIDKNKLSDGDTFTFEFRNGSYHEVQNPEWWQGKFSKPLVEGLRIEATHSVPVTFKKNAWRVILHFKSKQNNYWVTNSFGSDKKLVEYIVWIDSKELISRELPNTEKSAEILAVDYGIKRFNETGNESESRSILEINENNVACFNGQCYKDQILPEEFWSN